MISRIALSVLFLISALTCPWWLTAAFGILLLSFFEAWFLVILGGVLTDAAFGVPLAPLGGFAYLYTALAVLLATGSWFLHRTLSE